LLDADYTTTEKISSNPVGVIGRPVVYDVDVNPLSPQALKRCGEDIGFVVDGHDGGDTKVGRDSANTWNGPWKYHSDSFAVLSVPWHETAKVEVETHLVQRRLDVGVDVL
jgi:hypothetical protein